MPGVYWNDQPVVQPQDWRMVTNVNVPPNFESVVNSMFPKPTPKKAEKSVPDMNYDVKALVNCLRVHRRTVLAAYDRRAEQMQEAMSRTSEEYHRERVAEYYAVLAEGLRDGRFTVKCGGIIVTHENDSVPPYPGLLEKGELNLATNRDAAGRTKFELDMDKALTALSLRHGDSFTAPQGAYDSLIFAPIPGEFKL